MKKNVSFDLSRRFFNMDEDRSKIVKEAFILLYERWTLYRAKRIINLCYVLQTEIIGIKWKNYKYQIQQNYQYQDIKEYMN